MNTQEIGEKVTVDQLAEMVARGFLSMDKKFDELASEAKEVKINIANIDKKLDMVNYHYEQKISKLEDRTSTLKYVIENDLKTKVIW